MAVQPFQWPRAEDFRNRVEELGALEAWWDGPAHRQMLIYGRRRVGKSWLFRRFAHGKPAIILVVRSETAEAQFGEFAAALEPALGVTPEIRTPGELVRACYRAGRRARILVVVDEFQNLLPAHDPEKKVLKDIAAVIEEERDTSETRLVICGSAIRAMEALLEELNPLHGRFQSLSVPPISFREALPFLAGLGSTAERIERYAICGGVPLYLTLLGGGAVKATVCANVIHRFGTLHDEIRTVLNQELREPRTYFALLRLLAEGDKASGELANPLGMKATDISQYLSNLETLRLVRRRVSIGAGDRSRSGSYSLLDYFARFWFRFVFPYQDEIDGGLSPASHYDAIVRPNLNDHVAPIFEDICREWVRARYGTDAQRVGSWWGTTAPDARANAPERRSEEIDIVGLRGASKTVTLIGECKWRNRAMDRSTLHDLRTFKIPSLEAAGFEIARECRILLFARAGFTKGLAHDAEASGDVELIDIERLARLS